jgi:CBS domain-containing protein
VRPRAVSDLVLRDVPVVHRDDSVSAAIERLLESDLPAVPVVDDRRKLCGIFGEREFMAALFPGYLKELSFAAFVPRTLDEAIEKRAACRHERVGLHMNREHIDVGPDASDLQIAEIFLHHRVLIVPVVDRGEITGVITRHDFFRALAESFLD